MSAPKAPAHLSPAMRRFWRDVTGRYQLDAHHLRLLEAACGSWDRAEEARLLVDAEGPVSTDRFGQRKPHPAVAIERDGRALFARLVLQLGLDLAPEAPRPATRWRS